METLNAPFVMICAWVDSFTGKFPMKCASSNMFHRGFQSRDAVKMTPQLFRFIEFTFRPICFFCFNGHFAGCEEGESLGYWEGNNILVDFPHGFFFYFYFLSATWRGLSLFKLKFRTCVSDVLHQQLFRQSRFGPSEFQLRLEPPEPDQTC